LWLSIGWLCVYLPAGPTTISIENDGAFLGALKNRYKGDANQTDVILDKFISRMESFDLFPQSDDGMWGWGPGFSTEVSVSRMCADHTIKRGGWPSYQIPGVRKRHRTCAVVGASGLLRLQEYGAEIDAHEAVFRINSQPTEGYEPFVGRKTTYNMVNVFMMRANHREEYVSGKKPCPVYLVRHEILCWFEYTKVLIARWCVPSRPVLSGITRHRPRVCCVLTCLRPPRPAPPLAGRTWCRSSPSRPPCSARPRLPTPTTRRSATSTTPTGCSSTTQGLHPASMACAGRGRVLTASAPTHQDIHQGAQRCGGVPLVGGDVPQTLPQAAHAAPGL
jgi:hypothetical protein